MIHACPAKIQENKFDCSEVMMENIPIHSTLDMANTSSLLDTTTFYFEYLNLIEVTDLKILGDTWVSFIQSIFQLRSNNTLILKDTIVKKLNCNQVFQI